MMGGSKMKNKQKKEAYEQIPEDLKEIFIDLTNDYRKRKRTMFNDFKIAEIILLLLLALSILVEHLTLWVLFFLISMYVTFLFYNHYSYKMLDLMQYKWEKILGTPPYLDFSDMEEMHERWLKRKQ